MQTQRFRRSRRREECCWSWAPASRASRINRRACSPLIRVSRPPQVFVDRAAPDPSSRPLPPSPPNQGRLQHALVSHSSMLPAAPFGLLVSDTQSSVSSASSLHARQLHVEPAASAARGRGGLSQLYAADDRYRSSEHGAWLPTGVSAFLSRRAGAPHAASAASALHRRRQLQAAAEGLTVVSFAKLCLRVLVLQSSRAHRPGAGAALPLLHGAPLQNGQNCSIVDAVT